jgi:hypothetical protein
MSHENMRAIDEALRGLSVDDKIAALILSLIEYRPDAVGAVVSLIATIGVMTRGLSQTNQVMLAELLRDCADRVERRRQVVPIG